MPAKSCKTLKVKSKTFPEFLPPPKTYKLCWCVDDIWQIFCPPSKSHNLSFIWRKSSILIIKYCFRIIQILLVDQNQFLGLCDNVLFTCIAYLCTDGISGGGGGVTVYPLWQSKPRKMRWTLVAFQAAVKRVQSNQSWRREAREQENLLRRKALAKEVVEN